MADSETPETDKPPKPSKPVKPPAQPNPKPKGSGAKSKPKSAPSGGNDAKPKGSGRPPGRPTGLDKQLADFFNQVAMIVSAFNLEDGMVIANNSETLAKAWGDLAREDKRVKEAIEKMLKGSAWSGVFMATGTVALGIASNHGVFDNFSLFGGSDEELPQAPEVPRTPGEAPPAPEGAPPGLWT